MKMFRTTAALLGATALGATAALAQMTTPGAQQQTMPQQDMQQQQEMQQQATPPDTSAAPSASAKLTNADVTDSDVDQFATAVLAVQKVQGDASIAASDKQKNMADAVKQAGMTPEKFNAIAQASQSDPALMKRIQTAAAAKMQPAPGGSSGSAGG